MFLAVPTSTARGNPNGYLHGRRVPSRVRVFLTEWIPTILEFSSQVLIHIIIGSASKSGQKTSKQKSNGKKNGASRATHTPWKVTMRASYARVPYALLPRAGVGQRHRVGRFACGAGRAGLVRAPDACPLPGEDAPHQLVIDTCRSPVPPLSSVADRRVAASTLSPAFFFIFQVSFPFRPIFFRFFYFPIRNPIRQIFFTKLVDLIFYSFERISLNFSDDHRSYYLSSNSEKNTSSYRKLRYL